MSSAVFHVGQVDGRFTAWPHFKLYIEEKSQYVIDQGPDFFTLREWCWNTFGPSLEFRYWLQHKSPNRTTMGKLHNTQWCWDTEFGKQRIYLSQDALVLFNLKWI